MNQKIKSLPLKKVLFFQKTICVFCLICMLVCSLGTLFSLPFDDDFSLFYESKENIDGIFDETPLVRFDFVSSVLSLVKVFSLINYTSTETEHFYNHIKDHIERFSFSVNSDAIAYQLTQSFDYDFTIGIYYCALIFISVFFPLFLLASLLIIWRKHKKYTKKKYHERYKATMLRFRGVIGKLPLFILLTAISPLMKFGYASIIIFILAAAGLIVHIASARLKEYTSAQTKYLNMIQTTSFLGIIIYGVFYVTVKKSMIISKIIAIFETRSLSDFLNLFANGNFYMDELLPLIAAILFICGLSRISNSLFNNLSRIAFITTKMKRRDYTSGDAYINTTLAPLLMPAVVLLLFNSQSEIIFYGSELTNFIIASLCLLLMTATEIAVVFLRETLCIDLGNGGRLAVLEGTTYHPDEE